MNTPKTDQEQREQYNRIGIPMVSASFARELEAKADAKRVEIEHLQSQLELAKAACNNWAKEYTDCRKELDALKDSLTKITTELPTEPGFYWWRETNANDWEKAIVYASISGELMGMFYDNNVRTLLSLWTHYKPIGEWQRIQKPL